MVEATEVNQEALRERTVEIARKHKASWIELGQCLHTVYKDKMFRNWNYLSFEAYCIKELGIKQATAAKLLKSYYFLEKEEPRLASHKFTEEESPRAMPNYESVNLLRLAKQNKNITPSEFSDIRESVIEKVKEPKEIRQQVKKILEQKEDRNPNEVRRLKRNAAIKRVLTSLSSARRELESENLLPDYLLNQMDELASKLADQIEE